MQLYFYVIFVQTEIVSYLCYLQLQERTFLKVMVNVFCTRINFLHISWQELEKLFGNCGRFFYRRDDGKSQNIVSAHGLHRQIQCSGSSHHLMFGLGVALKP